MTEELNALRRKINICDASIIKLFAKRCNLVKEIGLIKKDKDMCLQDIKRERELFKLYHHLCNKYNVNSKLVFIIFKNIIRHSLEIQNKR